MSTRLTPVRVTWFGVWANVALFIVKTAAGLAGRSQVLLADGIHSLSDLVSDFVTLVALRMGRKPVDERHPYGHGKIEDMAAFIVGSILAVVAVGILWKALGSFQSEVLPSRSPWLLGVALLSVFIKEALFRITLRVGKSRNSSTLIANAWHHRSDAFSSLATVFGTGLFFLSERFVWADAASAMFVAFFVGKAAFEIIRDAVKDLVDTAPSEVELASFRSHALKVDGVLGVARLRGRFYSRRVALDIDIEVSGTLSVDEGHELAHQVRDALFDEFPAVYDVVVHVDPASDSR